jgi:hypothetical protein
MKPFPVNTASWVLFNVDDLQIGEHFSSKSECQQRNENNLGKKLYKSTANTTRSKKRRKLCAAVTQAQEDTADSCDIF